MMFASRTKPRVSTTDKRQAPYLKSGKLLGHAQFMQADPLGFMTKTREQHGDIVRLRLMHIQAYLLSHPAHVKHVLTTNMNNYTKQTRGYRTLRLLLGNGLVTSEGSFWKRQRRIAQPAFHKKRLSGFVEAMCRSTEEMAAQWAHSAANRGYLDIADEMMRLTLRIAGETLFGCDLSDESQDVGKSIKTCLYSFNDVVSIPFPYPEYLPIPSSIRFRKAKRQLDDVVNTIIADRRKSTETHHDLLAMFMEATDEETGERMDDQQLRDESMTMLSAGHETTANGLAWTFYLLSKHPEVTRRIHEELAQVLNGRAPTMADLPNLRYLKQVLQESLRLYPPVWALARKTEKDDEIDGYHIAANSFVFFSAYAIHRHPDFWDNPEGFDPERFSPENIEQHKKTGLWKFLYHPFSTGQRKCIGDQFALMEMQIVLAILLQRFRVDLVPGHPVVPETSVTLRPKHGIHMTVHTRKVQEAGV